MIQKTFNSIIEPGAVEHVRLEQLEFHKKFVREKRTKKRDLRDLRHKETAAAAVAGLTKTNEIYGFTKGQFSLLQLLEACLEVTGPAHMSLSTWTAARHEIQKLQQLREAGLLTGTRWLVDFTFARRDPEAAHQIRTAFGVDSIRVAQTHAKFAVFQNDEWKLVLRTSMNLNMNPRFEDFTIAHDPPLADFLNQLLDSVWKKQTRSLAGARPAEISRFWRDQM